MHNPAPLATHAEFEHKIDLEKMRRAKQAMVALKNAYGGALMFTMLGSLVGVLLGPIGLGIGLVMGHRGLREEKKRQVAAAACGGPERDPPLLRRGHLRGGQGLARHAAPGPAAAARPLQRRWPRSSTGPTRRRWPAPSEAAKRTQAEREKRLEDVDAELARLRQLRQRAAGGDRMTGPDRPHPGRRSARPSTVYRGTELRRPARRLRDRLDEPLRVAVAGRVKAGKSTLLNALVGERLAPTDAGECTRVVTWYQDGHTYQVMAHPEDGAPRQLRFTRDDGVIDIDLGGLTPGGRRPSSW